MGRRQDKELERLENHLAAAESMQADSAKVYNTDSADVNLDRYSRKVQGKSRKGCLAWLMILLILAGLGIFLYQLWGGG